MFGHPSEGLLWAPDSRDDLAFTLYAMDCEERDNIKTEIINQLVSGELERGNNFEDFVRFLSYDVSAIQSWSDADWDDIYPYWVNS